MARFAIIFSLISLIVTGTTYYFLKNRLALGPQGNRALFIVSVISFLSMVLGPLYYRFAHADASSPFTYSIAFFQYYMMGWIGITLIVFGAAEILQLLFKAFDPSKRVFLTEGVARSLFTATTLASVGGYIQMKSGPRLENIHVKLPTLPKSFDGLKIAQISDIHIGPILQNRFLEKVVDEVMALNADIIAITGDLVDGTVAQLGDQMRALKRLKASHGVYFCTGNHEFYSGVEEWTHYLESIGIHVFKNTNVILKKSSESGVEEKLMIAGVYDLQGERFSEQFRFDPVKASETTESVSCKILMTHNPQGADVCAQAGFHLQLSGHTHAGQFYPFVFLAKLAHKYFEGLYQINEHSQVYVNRGTGFWGPPNRLGKMSEITLLTLRS